MKRSNFFTTDIITGDELTLEEMKEFLHTDSSEEFFRKGGKVFSLTLMMTIDEPNSPYNGYYDLDGESILVVSINRVNNTVLAGFLKDN